MSLREPRLDPVPVSDLRPTQITVGQHEVNAKRREWRNRVKNRHGDGVKDDGDDRAAAFLGKHMIPVVLGPKGRPYVLDHHHLARALMDEGVKQVLVFVIKKLDTLSKASFWVYMDNHAWCHPYDETGRRRDFADIPGSIADLKDDPYRSLAGELRRAGGFAKDTTPFSEFTWADFLRSRVKPRLIEEDFPAALKRALVLAKGEDASYLPGWCGPDPMD
jgi:hypothetical protein